MLHLTSNQNNTLIIIILAIFSYQVYNKNLTSIFEGASSASGTFYDNDFDQEKLDKIAEKKASVLATVNDLNDIEQNLIDELMELQRQGNDEDVNVDEVKEKTNEIIVKITGIGNQKKASYQGLVDDLNSLSDKYGQTRQELVNQEASKKMIKGYLEDIEKNNNIYKNELSEKQKKTEINTYYSKRYRNITILMKSLIFYIAIFVVILVLSNYNIIGEMVQNISMAVIGAITIIHLGKKFVDFYFRNTIHFDEYDWPFNKNRGNNDGGDPINVGKKKKNKGEA